MITLWINIGTAYVDSNFPQQANHLNAKPWGSTPVIRVAVEVSLRFHTCAHPFFNALQIHLKHNPACSKVLYPSHLPALPTCVTHSCLFPHQLTISISKGRINKLVLTRTIPTVPFNNDIGLGASIMQQTIYFPKKSYSRKLRLDRLCYIKDSCHRKANLLLSWLHPLSSF